MPERTCACGCGASLDGMSPRAKYVSSAHRTRHWKETTGYVIDRSENARNADFWRRVARVQIPRSARRAA